MYDHRSRSITGTSQVSTAISEAEHGLVQVSNVPNPLGKQGTNP
jgi:hypothetical protein